MSDIIKERKFVVDENCRTYREQPPFIINCDRFLKEHDKQLGLADDKFMELATSEGYTIVTRDKGMIINAIMQGIEIVYLYDWRWYLIKAERIK